MKNPYNKINKDMECLKNKNCIPIIIGPTGPRGGDGKDGVADTIKIENTHILDFVIPKGQPGKEGRSAAAPPGRGRGTAAGSGADQKEPV